MVTMVIFDSKDSLDTSTPESLFIRTVVELHLFDFPKTENGSQNHTKRHLYPRGWWLSWSLAKGLTESKSTNFGCKNKT